MTGTVRFATIMAVALLSAASASAQQPAATAAPEVVPQAAAAPAASGSEVATVKSTNGKVLLNRATAYDPAAKDQRLVRGDRLVVLEGGAITVRYDDGCEETLDKPSIYTVSSTCGVAAADRGMAAPVGAAPAAAGSREYLKWGVVALAVVTPLILLNDSDSGRPISP
jgi:hypothetical protein